MIQNKFVIPDARVCDSLDKINIIEAVNLAIPGNSTLK
jgi:hypothetical protein